MFERLLIGWWLASVVLILLLSALRVNTLLFNRIILATIYPALIAWLAFNGVGILLTTVPQLRRLPVRRDAKDWLLLIAFILAGLVFTAGAVGILAAIAWRMAR